MCTFKADSALPEGAAAQGLLIRGGSTEEAAGGRPAAARGGNAMLRKTCPTP